MGRRPALGLSFLILASCAARVSTTIVDREPQALSRPCLEAAKVILDDRVYKEFFKKLENESVDSKFDVLSGLEELREQHPRRFKKTSKMLKRAAEKGLTPMEIENLVDELYRITHREWRIRTWVRDGYGGLKKVYIVDHFSQSLLRQNFTEVFSRAGLLREPGTIEAFRTRFKMEMRAVGWALAIVSTGAAIRSKVPFWAIPEIINLDRFVIPESLIEKIMNEGIDSAYGDLEKLVGRQGDFVAIWSEFRRYANYAAYGAVAYVVYSKAKTAYRDAAEKDFDDAKALGIQDETAREQEARIKKQLSEWKEKFREKRGREPSSQETEDMARILHFYGKSGQKTN
jgi:hypothetical protein